MNSTEPTLGQATKPLGRPRKLTVDETLEVYNAFNQFITDTPDPRISNFVSYNEVALQYNVTHDNICDWVDFSGLRKRAVRKQEDYLLEYGGNGRYNATIAIFRLKQPQHGYRDRQETDITTNGNDLGVGLSAEQAEQLIKARSTRSSV